MGTNETDLERDNRNLRLRVSELERQLHRFDAGARDQAALGESVLERSALLLEAERIARVGSWMWNVATNQVVWSDELFRILGCDPEVDRASYEAFFDRVHPDDRDRVRTASGRGIETGVSEQVTFRVQRPDGGVRHVVMDGALLFDAEGQLRRAVGTVADITERKRAEAEQARLEEQLEHARRLEALGTLAGGIAHDFNNLLAGLLSGLSIVELRVGQAPGAIADEVREMKALVRRGAELTRQLLGFGRRGKYDARPLDLAAVVEKTCEMFGRTRPDITITRALDPTLAPVLMDHAQLEQVLLNLFVNAGQAMPDGGRLTVRADNATLTAAETTPHGAAPGRFVRLVVADTGVGMDEATRARAFEPFFTTKPDGQGTGLGLASVYGIVTNHGGTIAVDSAPGEGATFTLHVPAADAAPQVIEAPAPDTPTGRGTILIVDDDERLLQVCARLVEELGYRVVTAPGGKEAVEVVRARGAELALVILDLTMPVMSGAKTFDAIRALAPGLKVLLYSGYSLDGQAQELMARGCDDFIQKPFDLELLASKLAALVP